MDREFHLHDGKIGAALAIRVIPRASRIGISEILDDGTIKVRLKTSGTDPASNQALLQLLAEVLEIPVQSLEVVAGQTGLDKLITVVNIDLTNVQKRIIQKLSD
jgi:uncharacterized protein YggU (UPF0235/DUF167 family)